MTTCESSRTVVALTGRQKVAIMLDNAGYKHRVIAKLMGLKNRESATRLIKRARTAEAAKNAAIAEFVGAS